MISTQNKQMAQFFASMTERMSRADLDLATIQQKYFTLRLKRGLITDGMFRFIRHPNYLGEMMIYCSFALMIWHWLPFVVLAWVWGGLFAVNMILKEANMSRYAEWTCYKSHSWWLLPPIL